MQFQSWLQSDCDYKYCGQQQKNAGDAATTVIVI